MPRNQFSLLKTRVIAELHDNSLTSRVGDFINETINDINNRTDFQFLKNDTTFATVASQQEYDIVTYIGATCDKILSITSRDPVYNLIEKNKQDILTFDPDPTIITSDPWAYYIQNGDIGLYPVPSGIKTLYVDYLIKATDLSADADTPAIPLNWTHVIIYGSVMRGLKYLRPGNPQTWASQEQSYEAGVMQMKGQAQHKPNVKFRMKSAQDATASPIGPRILNWKSS